LVAQLITMILDAKVSDLFFSECRKERKAFNPQIYSGRALTKQLFIN